MLRRAIKRNHDTTNKSTERKENIETVVVHKTALADRSIKDETEKVLESIVLGGEEEFVENLINPKLKNFKKKRLSKHRRTASDVVWVDDEDHVKTIASKTSEIPGWAKLKWQQSDNSDGEDSDNELLQSTGDYIRSSDVLPKNALQMKRCTDANKEKPSTGKLHNVEFHPTAQVLLTAGIDQTINLFQVDGKNNKKIQSIFLENYPIYTAHFTQDGMQVITGSKHKGFTYYDMIAGKVIKVPRIKGLEENNMKRFEISPDGRFIVFLGDYGHLHLLSASTKEWIDSLKMNGSVESAAFSSDGSRLFSIGDDGEVYIWDMNTRSAVHRFRDEGCLKGLAIAVSKNNHYVATGSYSGVVNLYDEMCTSEASPRPVKAVMNLTTPVTGLKFNASTEILAMTSNYTEQALKMLHVSSRTVFSNFPDRNERLRIPYSMDFSVNSGYFCSGNNSGQALLYRVKHYGCY